MSLDVSVDKEFTSGKYAYDIEVELNDVYLRNKMNNFVGGNVELNKNIGTLDEKASLEFRLIHV